MASVGARLHQHRMVRGSEGPSPSGADDSFLLSHKFWIIGIQLPLLASSRLRYSTAIIAQ